MKRWAVAQKYEGDICKFWHLPSNSVIANIALRDLDRLFKSNTLFFISLKRVKVTPDDLYLLFQGKQFDMLISRKQWELAQHVKWLEVRDVLASF